MATVDRAVRRAARDFAAMEGLVLAVTGYEDRDGVAGRRRVVLVVSDRRVLLVPVRGGPVVDVTSATAETEHDLFAFVSDEGIRHRWHGAGSDREMALLRQHLAARRSPGGPPRSPGVRLIS